MEPSTVTLDTGVFEAPELARVKAAAAGLPVDFVHISVSARELESATRTKVSERPVPETAVWGESRWGEAVWGDMDDCDLLESLLSVMSGGGFPKPGRRENLSDGNRHMLRDALVLQSHVREGHDILVSRDTRAYGKPGSSLRGKLEGLCSTRIMTVDEFVDECGRLRTDAQ
jgi:hypothetical protein